MPIRRRKKSNSGLAPKTEPSDRLVLDTNFFVELLDQLSNDGSMTRMPCQAGHPARCLRGARKTFCEIVQSRGWKGKLIVPVAVLIEAYGVVRVEGARRAMYRNADLVMEAIGIAGGDWSLWSIFAFEPVTMEVLDAFLGLHEGLIAGEPDRNRWPDFADALVLAHGLANRCPVISGEWVDKDDWSAVGRLFPHLVP